MSGGRSLDYDVKIYSLYDAHAPKTTTRAALDAGIAEHSLVQCPQYLTAVGKRATDRAPTITGEFRPLVLSPGGLIPRKSSNDFADWKRELDETI